MTAFAVAGAGALDTVSAVVRQGGSGATFGAVALGVPAVVGPGTAGLSGKRNVSRQPERGRRWSQLLADPTFTRAAFRIREEISTMPTVVHGA